MQGRGMRGYAPRRIHVAALSATVLMCGSALTQAPLAYPQRNVLMIVPYSPGTGADIAARALGPRLAERLKFSVVIDNRTGATGIIGSDTVAKAAPDGHVLLMTATSFATTRTLPSGMSR